jgi:hypothetical protein
LRCSRAVFGCLIRTRNEGLTGKNNSFGFGVRYPNDLWDLSIDWKQIEEHFRPALGFVPRTDVRTLSIYAEFGPTTICSSSSARVGFRMKLAA